tara:strand:- start:478 stop:1854 length:1377 start_codon:yes stop_codon:yes gene_type:complete
MASTYLTKTFSGAPTNPKKGTISLWFKLAGNDTHSTNTYYRVFTTGADSNNRTDLNITNPMHNGGGQINWSSYVGGGNNYTQSSEDWLLKDFGAYYHLVIAYDTTQAAFANRSKMYLNGVQLNNSAWAESNYPTQNLDLFYGNNSTPHHLGNSPHFSPRFFQGIISHFHYCDGYTYQASDFGSTDSITGEWKINTGPSVSYGNNGFFILKDSNSVTDQSPNTNNFTVAGGTLLSTIDNPSNNFATLNPLVNNNDTLVYQNGSNTMTTSSQWLGTTASLGMFKGKFYWEFKPTGNFMTGVSQLETNAVQTDYLNTANTGYSSRSATGYEIINGGNKSTNSGSSSYGPSYSNGDIGMVAFDATNGTLWFGKNGTWSNSATQTEIENGTTGNAAYTGLTNENGYIPSMSIENSTLHFNFGNGFFGTTAVSSAGTNASNIGTFEYNVPAGFTALCTKGLNSF